MNARTPGAAFVIEPGRRGYVVLALDQTGHGYSDGPAFANGFGGPDGLAYLRSLAFVDKDNIGLEGHSMGGWTVLAAAAAMPNDYKSMALEGFSTGKPFAANGTARAPFSHLRPPALADCSVPKETATPAGRWVTALLLSAFIPALTYYPAFALGGTFVTPSRFLPQGITNQILVWAVVNGLVALALMPFAPTRARRSGIIGPSILIALVTVAVGYVALWLSDLAFKIDFRFWIVALKLMSAKQFLIFLIYLLPFTVFFVIALHLLHRNFSTLGASRGALYLTNILALTLGFIVLVGAQYLTMWLSGKLFNPIPDPGFVPLSTIVAIQFVPLLAICAVIATFTGRRTGSSLPAALICGLFVTWYVVAGTATQVPF